MDTVVIALETPSKDDLTIDFLENRLMNEETRKKGSGRGRSIANAMSIEFSIENKSSVWK